MDLQLTDKPVIVCASSAGLGKAAAFEFAREGANVMLCGRRETELAAAVAEIKTATGRDAKFTVADLTKPDDIARVVAAAVAAFGGVYTLVNNSGGPPAGTFDQFDDAAWQKAFELNLLSFVRAIRAALPHMRAGGGGRIVNYTSSSVKTPIENLILSTTFRMGVLGMAKTLSSELGPDGILINVLAPGRIQTERIVQLDGLRATKLGRSVEDVRTETCKTIPLGRYGVPEEFAKLTAFLGSPANTYITGQTVLVDGGMVRAVLTVMKSAFDYTGVIPILATPFHDDESLDLESLARLITFNKSAGVHGITVLGLLGESNRLTDDDRARLVATAVKAAGGLPVIVGTSHTGTEATIALSKQAAELGATAVMITPSRQQVPSDKSVFDYFQRIAAKIALPIVLQDHPAISEVHMPVDLILRLVREIPPIVSIKAEALPSPQKIAALAKGMEGGRRATILTGLGALYGLFDLERGSDGFNTGFAFPEVLLAILREFRAGDHATALAIYTRHLPLLVFEQQPGLAIRKEILRLRGLLASNRVRHPGATIDAATSEQLRRLLDTTFPGEDLTRPLRIAP